MKQGKGYGTEKNEAVKIIKRLLKRRPNVR